MYAIQIKNVVKEYKNGVQALSGLNLTVKQGELFSLLGQNGAGKSTLIRILTTYLKPTSGHIVMFATVYKGNIIKNLIMDCQSYTKYRPNETTGGIFVSWRRKEELPTGA